MSCRTPNLGLPRTEQFDLAETAEVRAGSSHCLTRRIHPAKLLLVALKEVAMLPPNPTQFLFIREPRASDDVFVPKNRVAGAAVSHALWLFQRLA